MSLCPPGAGTGDVGVVIVDPQGRRDTVEVILEDKGDSIFRCTYRPVLEGPHTIYITFAGAQIPKSPFVVNVAEACNPNACRAMGRGLQPKGVRVKEVADFKVYTKGAGTGELKVTVKGPKGTEEPVKVREVGDGVYECDYYPVVAGKYVVSITWGGHAIPRSPFEVQVGPEAGLQKVRAWGPGLETGMVGKSADFVVEAIGTEVGTLGFSIEGPSQAKIECDDKGDGSCDVRYWPTEPGEYAVHVICDDEDIKDSPFIAHILPATNEYFPEKVKAFGPGLEAVGCIVNKPAEFTIDARGAGKAELKIYAQDAEGVPINIKVKDNGDHTFSCVYVPTKPIKHTIIISWGGVNVPKSPFRGNMAVTVTYGGDPIPKSPFPVTVAPPLDLSKVKVQGLNSKVDVGRDQEFAVNTKGAGGQGEVDVKISSPSRRPIPCKVETGTTNDIHSVKYMPPEEGPYKVDITYDGHPVPGSPFSVEAVMPPDPSKIKVLPAHDASKVRASGPGLNASGIPASLPVEFTIDARDAGEGLLTVQILDPEGKPKKANIRDNGDGTYTVSYVPDMTGRYTITIKYGGDEIPYSPFRIHALPAGDASKCLVTVSIGGHGLGTCLGPTIQIGEETVITVDAKAAGKGKVTCKVSTPDGAELDVDVVENHDGTFDIYYTAPEPGKYVITIRFGGEQIPNSPFHVVACDSAPQVEEPCDSVQLQLPFPAHHAGGGYPPHWATDEPVAPPENVESMLRPFNLVIPFTVQKGEITGEVRMPSGKTARPHITDNKDGTVTVKYAPVEKGLHEMDIKYDGNHIPGSPIQFYVDAINARHVSAYGPGLSHGMVNKPATFTIVTKDAGEGGLSLAVEGPSKAEITCKDNKDGTCTVSYLPTAPGDYNIIVRFDDKHIPGSPFTAKITGDDSMRTSQLNVGTSTDVSLKITESDLSLLTASIRAPSGNEEPCLLKRLPNRHIGISFTPKEVGEHIVSVKKSSKHVTNSPFKIMVGQSEIGDASKVKVSGKGLVEGRTFEVSEFIVDTRTAGYGGLGLSIEGPSKVDINCEDMEDGTCKVTYCPTEPGNYIINIKFADKHVPGSPFTVKMTGEGRMKESITRRRQAPSIATIGSTCDLNLKIPGNWFQMVSGSRTGCSAKTFITSSIAVTTYTSALADGDQARPQGRAVTKRR
uniref:Uncharacterized protein n=1 Tax=Sphaerodactylus townsendi TaxID=933632 RepID=A0ACB8FMS4_9SAUR